MILVSMYHAWEPKSSQFLIAEWRVERIWTLFKERHGPQQMYDTNEKDTAPLCIAAKRVARCSEDESILASCPGLCDVLS